MPLQVNFCSHLQELQPWFKVDPIILRLFVRKTQIADIPVLISKVSLSILIMRLAEESFDDAEVKCFNDIQCSNVTYTYCKIVDTHYDRLSI